MEQAPRPDAGAQGLRSFVVCWPSSRARPALIAVLSFVTGMVGADDSPVSPRGELVQSAHFAIPLAIILALLA